MTIEHAGTCSIFNTSNSELAFESGNGGYVFDTTGKKYLDFILGFGPVILGHNDSEFNEYIIDHLKMGIHLPSYTIHHHKLLGEIIVISDCDVSFFKTSSEAVTAAIRIVTQITNKKGIIRCGYIGWHDAQIASTICWHEYPHSPLRNNVRFENGFRGVSVDERVYNWSDLNISSLKEIIDSDMSIGTFIIDAYQLHFTSINILHNAIEICKKHGIFVIIDETKTSGRISQMGISDLYGLDFDILVMGKALANGAPLSLLVGSQGIMSYAKSARITGTFSKEVLSIWCALATAKIMKERNGYVEIKKIGEKICATINAAIIQESVDEYVECVPIFNASIFDFKFTSAMINNKVSREHLRKLFVDEGILLLQGHPSFVCLAHNEIDYNKFYDTLCIVFNKWRISLQGNVGSGSLSS